MPRDSRPTVSTEESSHRHTARCIRVGKFFEAILAGDLDLLGLDSEIRTKNATSDFSASTAVAEMSSSMAGEQF